MPIFLLLVIVLAVVLGIYHVVGRDKALRISLQSKSKKAKVVFVVAHPDDECMFFSPTILSFTAQPAKYVVYILCLSSGDYYKKGHLRENELVASCSLMGVKRNHVKLIDDSRLKDDPSLKWDKKLVADIVLQEVAKNNIDVVFTFDELGVSGHLNHKSAYKGVQFMLTNAACPIELQVFQLVSVSLIRKYMSVMDTFYSYLTASMIFTSPWLHVWKAQQAMMAHRSQFVWFRLLYIAFSRYMIINTYEIIEPPFKPEDLK